MLLRGINLGPHRRIAMAQLRSTLSEAGFEEVQTYLQSGNVVLRSRLPADEVEAACESLISSRFGLEVPVIVRTGQELLEAVERDPLGSEAEDHKLYQVTFLERELEDDRVRALESLAAPPERLISTGREIYTWHPEGLPGQPWRPSWPPRASGSRRPRATGRRLRICSQWLGGNELSGAPHGGILAPAPVARPNREVTGCRKPPRCWSWRIKPPPRRL